MPLSAALTAGAAALTIALAVDIAPLWNFADPAASEQRLRAALAMASGDDALVLQTQIARSRGLQRDVDGARALLIAIEPQVAKAGAEARARWSLELGRTYASAAHEAPSAADRDRARSAYADALATARAAGLDALAIDAIHMFAFVDTAPADQLRHGRDALAIALASAQPAAQRWQASIRNNIGYALHQLGRYDEALAEFERALALRRAESGPSPGEPERSARWMVAWTLRALKRDDEALAMQLQLERDGDAAGAPDAYVFEELETLYRSRGDAARADRYAGRRRALAGN